MAAYCNCGIWMAEISSWFLMWQIVEILVGCRELVAGVHLTGSQPDANVE